MTREEAIKTLKGEAWLCCAEKWNEALEMAIKALEQEPSGDLISRQAADEIKELMTDINGDTVYAVRMSYLRQLPSVNPKEPKWIPVSERLPEENGYYLTTTMHHEVYCDYWEEERFNRTEAVIAWMPLPKPYEQERSDEE